MCTACFNNQTTTNFTTLRNFSDVECNDYHFLLAFIHANTCLLWSGRVLFLGLMLFVYLGVTKIDEFLMIAIERITTLQESKQIENNKKTIWTNNALVDITLRALGSNSFEILYPIGDLVFGRVEQTTHATELSIIIVMHSFYNAIKHK